METYDDFTAAHRTGDYAAALRLIRPLAERGDANAQALLAGLYFSGNGLPEDLYEAMKWYRLAADQGHAEAQAQVGLMFFVGLGVPEDQAEATRWYLKAAEQGLLDAQFTLGQRYAAGQGVARNYVQAFKWMSLAEANYPVGTRFHTRILRAREIVVEHLTPSQIIEATGLAREWKPNSECP